MYTDQEITEIFKNCETHKEFEETCELFVEMIEDGSQPKSDHLIRTSLRRFIELEGLDTI